MPHVVFVPLTGFRLREDSLLELGMTLPGLEPRARAVGQLPALGPLTLASMLPERWTCSYLPAARVDSELIEQIAVQHPHLVAISALAASVEEAYRLCDMLRRREIRTVLGGLHATAMPVEASAHADCVVVGRGCAQILVGIESLVFRYPGMGQKRAELSEEAVALIDSLLGAGTQETEAPRAEGDAVSKQRSP